MKNRPLNPWYLDLDFLNSRTVFNEYLIKNYPVLVSIDKGRPKSRYGNSEALLPGLPTPSRGIRIKMVVWGRTSSARENRTLMTWLLHKGLIS